jgi:hypothetical protein
MLAHLGEPLELPPVSPARGPPTDWGDLVQIHDDREEQTPLLGLQCHKPRLSVPLGYLLPGHDRPKA